MPFGRQFRKISYNPGLLDTGDLEPSTKTVSATSKPATPDYSKILSLAVPPTGLNIDRTFARLDASTSAFDGGASKLNWSVHINGTEKMSGYFGAPAGGAAASGVFTDLGSGTWFVEIYLWVDAGSVGLTEIKLRGGVGTNGTEERKVVHYGAPDGALVSCYTKICRNESIQHPRLKVSGCARWEEDGEADIEQDWSDAFLVYGDLEWYFRIEGGNAMSWLDNLIMVEEE